jgi:hypothetical protein
MKRRMRKKLSLNRETVRNLDRATLRFALGRRENFTEVNPCGSEWSACGCGGSTSCGETCITDDDPGCAAPTIGGC